MSTQAIERNYRKNPHTATFLQVFHTGVSSTTGRNYREEMSVSDNQAEVELAAQDDDLLNLVPVGQGYRPSPAQESYIVNLTTAIAALDNGLASQASDYTERMTANNAWTRENTSHWIDNLKAKRDALRAAAPAPTTSPAAEVADGRYAVEEDGVLRFFKVKNGRRAGFVFLDIQASDDWHSIRNLTRIRSILALIAVDAKAAMIRYGQELGECGHCGRVLTDPESRAAGIGPICQGR